MLSNFDVVEPLDNYKIICLGILLQETITVIYKIESDIYYKVCREYML